MSLSEQINPDRLTKPISLDEPSGPWLKEEMYDTLKKLRWEEDPEEFGETWKRKFDVANWPEVIDRCLTALTDRSKDLKLAVWLTEGLTARYGVSGLTAGLQILEKLLDVFWATIHPVEDDGLFEHRANILATLNFIPVEKLRLAPLTAPNRDGLPYCCLVDFENAEHLTQLHVRDKKAYAQELADGKHTPETVALSVAATPSAVFIDLKAHIDEALAAWQALDRRCDICFGVEHAPSLIHLRDTLVEISAKIGGLLATRGVETKPSAPAKTKPAPPAPNPVTGVPAVDNGPISSREDAYRRLAQVADYLMRTEPHSPTPYLIRRAVSWGDLTLSELLPELLAGHADLGHVSYLLGLTLHDRE